jgi:hypothetical protein
MVRTDRFERKLYAFGAELPIALIALMATRCHSKSLARSVALIGEQAPATSTRATMTRDAVSCWGRLLGQPLPPQLLHAGADCLEIVSCSGP